MKIRDRLGITPGRQRDAVTAMRFVMVGLVFVGVYSGNLGIVLNAAVGVAVTYLPGVLERDYGVPVDAGLSLWITGAVFLHAVGVAGLPGSEQNLYRGLWWWDHLTHALSSSVVAAVGYTAVRALDEHTDDIYIPDRLVFVFVLVFVAAFGVVWEVIEFSLGGLSSAVGGDPVLTQFGLGDTMLDLLFDVIGGVLAGLYGTAHLTDVVGYLSGRFEAREDA